MKRRSAFFAARVAAFFAACALAWGSAFCATAADPSGVPTTPTTTIQAGADFDMPLLVAGKPAIGRAHLAADNVLRIYWVDNNRIAGPLLLRIGGDVQPGPGPTPTPLPIPTPTPTPTPLPVPTPGKLSIVVCIPKTFGELPPEQSSALSAAEVLAYLNTHCVRVKMKLPDGSEGDTAAWRVLSAKADPAGLPENLRAAFTEAKARPLPTITIFNGKDAYRGDLPKNAADLLAKLKTFGGP